MPFTQEIIHKLEQGGGMRYLRLGLAVLAVVGFIAGYNLRAFKNFSTQEAMDAAQVARNLSEGRGYTTHFVRPLSIYLVKRVNEKTGRGADGTLRPDYAQLRTMHPDLANPPVYPTVLAGLMKVLPFSYEATASKRFWSQNNRFWRYQPDFLISLFNQGLFFAMIVVVFFLARRLFDSTVAWLSAVVLFGTELFWRFAVSGLSTMLLLLLFSGLLWGLYLVEREAREPQWSPGRVFGLAAGIGLLMGVGCLTRYAFGWLLVPVIIYLALFSGPRRAALCLVVFFSFAVVVTPWVVRNVMLSGLPFGLATFSVLEGSIIFPGNQLARSLTPGFDQVYPAIFWHKLFQNLKIILTTDGPRLAGSWVAAFFLVGVLMNFRNPALQRLRYFVLLCLPVLTVVQAMGRTYLSDDAAEINTENLLVLLAPVVIVYGVGFFVVLVDQLELPLRWLRYLIMGVFVTLVCAPLFLVFLPPRPLAVAYPPYYPPVIQQIGAWMGEDELIMSDVPWAVAWYGRRQSVWLTRDTQADYFAIHDTQKSIRGLYLTPQMMDSRFYSEWVKAGERSWGNFVIDSVLRREVPPWFPLRAAPAFFPPEQLFLSDWARWRRTPQAAPAGTAPPAAP